MSAHQRNKGKRFEQAVARELRSIFGDEVRRGWQAREGTDEPDIICPHFAIECKVGKKPPYRRALEQALGCSGGGKMPVAVVKEDRKEPVVVMWFSDFLALAREWDREEK